MYRPALLNELFCRVELLAELFHLLVVAEALFVVLVELQALSDVAAREQTDRVRCHLHGCAEEDKSSLFIAAEQRSLE